MNFSRSLKLKVILLFCIAAVIFSSWLLAANFGRLREIEGWVRHTQSVVSELDLTISAMKDAETGLRGYLLTGDREQLGPYSQGSIDVQEHIARLKFLVQDNPNQQALLTALEAIVLERLRVLKEALERMEKARKYVPSSNVSEGKVLMDSLRRQVTEMKDEENHLLALRTEDANDSVAFIRVLLLVTTAFLILLLTFVYWILRRDQRRQEDEARARAREVFTQGQLAETSKNLSAERALPVATKNVLNRLCRLLHAPVGSFYIPRDGVLRRVASYAQDKEIAEVREGSEIRIGQGLLGEAFLRDDLTEIFEIPSDYLWVSSGLGRSPPKGLVLVPVRFQDAAVGILEIAVFERLSAEDRELLRRLREVIGVGVASAVSREHTQSLLEKTQQQAEELQAQQEELRASNEELEEQTRILENQQNALNLRNQELEIAQSEIQAKAADLEKLNQYKSEFLAKMSHELRTPLNSLLILATLLIENREGNLTPQQKEFARTIHNSGADLLNLINDILDLSKIEARKLTLRPEAFTVAALFEQLRQTFEPMVKKKDLEFAIDVGKDAGAIVLNTDRLRVEQILRNFLSNAIKFTEKGSIRLAAAVHSAGFVTLSTIDTGIGIADGKKQLIFEAFEQADGSISRKYGGTGLGLTISRELAHLLGGQIRMESAEGKGSSFYLEIPTELPSAASGEFPPRPFPMPAAVPASPSSQEWTDAAREALKGVSAESKKTLLIVEDDEAFRRSVAGAAREHGFTPIEVGSGEAALEVLKLQTPAAVLLDIKLPGLSGMGLLETVKKMPSLRHVPIHMISALEYRQNALKMGAVGFLGKPVTLDGVRGALTRIEDMLSRRIKRVLVIEDDANQRKAVTELIQGGDVAVTAVGTAGAALDAVRAETLDCIILDLSLPDMSGTDFLERLSREEVLLPPVVVYTGRDLSRKEEEHLRRFSESIVLKGAKSPERLLDEVNLFLHRLETALPGDKQALLKDLRSQDESFQGRTVLLVDDDLRNVFALMSALEARGFSVVVARNGMEAIETLQKTSPVDIVLMDIMMPKMDGYEAITRIRAMKRYEKLPIVALTAKAMKGDHEKTIQAGANDYLPKPVSLENLFSVLKVWLPVKGFVS